MTLILAISVAIIFAVSVYMLLSRELKAIAMGVFLLGHAANLCLLAMSGTPTRGDDGKAASAPLVGDIGQNGAPLANIVDPVPQALILTAIVIGFGVMGFLLTLLIVTHRKTGTLVVEELEQAQEADHA